MASARSNSTTCRSNCFCSPLVSRFSPDWALYCRAARLDVVAEHATGPLGFSGNKSVKSDEDGWEEDGAEADAKPMGDNGSIGNMDTSGSADSNGSFDRAASAPHEHEAVPSKYLLLDYPKSNCRLELPQTMGEQSCAWLHQANWWQWTREEDLEALPGLHLVGMAQLKMARILPRPPLSKCR